MLTIALVVLGLIALVLVIAALQPDDCRHTRRALIPAPVSAVFPHVNELPKWLAWSPWEKMDPAMKRTFDGPDAGPGAIYAWDGNRNIGAGRMTITESRPNEVIRLKLEFFRPFACTNRVEFTFTPEAGGTTVSWTMEGKMQFIGKVMGLFMNMDKMIGGQFEEGLANLARVAGAASASRV